MKKLHLIIIPMFIYTQAFASTMGTTIQLGQPITITEAQPGFIGNIVYQTTDGALALLPNGSIARPVGFSGTSSDAIVSSSINPIYTVNGSPSSTVTLTMGNFSSITSGSSSLLSFSGGFLPVGSEDPTQGSSTTAVSLSNKGIASVSNIYLAVYSSSSDVQGTYTGTYEVIGSY